jgi:hypothetical protein
MAKSKDKFLPFEEARNYVRRLSMKSFSDYSLWAKSSARPSNIPVAPCHIYKNEWISWSDWLGVVHIMYDVSEDSF